MIFYLLIFLLLNYSCAREKTSETKTIDVETREINVNGLAKYTNKQLKYTSGIRSIFHDSKGNYWFGSDQEGVCLFDGNVFTYFTVNDGLSDHQIRTIQEDENGTIWFGTGNGVSSYKEGKIENHTSQSAFIENLQIVKENWALTEKDLWFNAGNKSGTYRYSGQKLSYLVFPIEGDEHSFNSYAVTGFSKGKKGNLWIASYAAIFGYDGETFTIIDDEYLGFIEEYKKLHVRSILEDSKGNLWIGNNGIGVLLKSGDSIINFSQDKGLTHINAFGIRNGSVARILEHVFAIEEDSQGNIWFGDRDTGAWKYDGKTITNYSKKDGLTTSFVQTIYKDNNDELWFGLADGNVFKFNEKTFDKQF